MNIRVDSTHEDTNETWSEFVGALSVVADGLRPSPARQPKLWFRAFRARHHANVPWQAAVEWYTALEPEQDSVELWGSGGARMLCAVDALWDELVYRPRVVRRVLTSGRREFIEGPESFICIEEISPAIAERFSLVLLLLFVSDVDLAALGVPAWVCDSDADNDLGRRQIQEIVFGTGPNLRFWRVAVPVAMERLSRRHPGVIDPDVLKMLMELDGPASESGGAESTVVTEGSPMTPHDAKPRDKATGPADDVAGAEPTSARSTGEEEVLSEKPARGAEATSDGEQTSTPKPPSEKALIAWRVHYLMGITDQTEIAETMTKRGCRATQGEVSRWLKQVREYQKAGGQIPEWHERHATVVTVDPAVLDMGENQEHRSLHQRWRRDDPAD